MKEKIQRAFSAMLASIDIKHKGLAAMIFVAILVAGGVILGPLIALQLVLLEIGAALGGVFVWLVGLRLNAWRDRRRNARLEASLKRLLKGMGIEEQIEQERQVVEIAKR